jgi:hypothetical protein
MSGNVMVLFCFCFIIGFVASMFKKYILPKILNGSGLGKIYSIVIIVIIMIIYANSLLSFIGIY